MLKDKLNDTIVALSTAHGQGSIAIIRLSGAKAITITDKIFHGIKGKKLEYQLPNTIHFGEIRDGEQLIDEVLVSVFKNPNSYTKEDSIEISCHSSPYIIDKIIELAIQKGARPAEAGEFTKRAYLNGRFDLAQAESVAELIAAASEITHKISLQNMKGGFSNMIKKMRKDLIEVTSLLELELDFSEEDVEFVNKEDFKIKISTLVHQIDSLLENFKLKNVIKDGIPIVIVGKPNVGKSTLLNVLLNEDKAIVSKVPGTTRDFIEDLLVINNIKFRIIDTAGLRVSDDEVEKIGIQRSYDKIKSAHLILYLIDLMRDNPHELKKEIDNLSSFKTEFIIVGNKLDMANEANMDYIRQFENHIFISSKDRVNIDTLKGKICSIGSINLNFNSFCQISNMRHFEILVRCNGLLKKVITEINCEVSSEFILVNIRKILDYFGEITGEITNDTILDNIFSNFCIGK